MLEDLFQRALPKSKVVSTRIIRRSADQRSKGFGFVEFAEVEDAVKAVKKL